MKRKGFTLVELLAVIVILAIIALITTVVVINIIETVKIRKYKVEEKSLEKAAELYYTNSQIFPFQDEISLNTLVEKGFINSVKDTGNGSTCEGKVIKDNNGELKGCLKCSNYVTEGCGYVIEQEIKDENPGVICGNGTEEDYDKQEECHIKSVEDLVAFSYLVNSGKTFAGKTVYLDKDLDITNYVKEKSYVDPDKEVLYDINGDGETTSLKDEMTTDKGFQPIGTRENNFKGKFKGNAYTISNLMINRPNEDNVGLFGYLEGIDADNYATIMGLNIKNINVKGNNNVGGVAGTLESYAKINEIAMDGNIEATGSKVGGIVGYMYASSIYVTSVISNTNVTGYDNVGGLVGNCFSCGAVQGIVESGTIKSNKSNVYGSGNKISTAYVNSKKVNLIKNLEEKTDNYVGIVYEDSPTGNINLYDKYLDTWLGGDNDGSGYYFDYESETSNKIVLRSNPINTKFEKGSGTKESPYLIYNAEDMKKIAAMPKVQNYYKLMSDIDYNNEHYYMIGTRNEEYSNKSYYFAGIIDGNLHTIKNVEVKGYNNIGLIGYANSAGVQGLNVENATIVGNNNVGLFGYVSGENSNNPTTIVGLNIKNINVKGNSTVGGVVGDLETYTKINEIAIDGNIEATGNQIGGIVGYKYGDSVTLTSVISNTNVKGNNYVGGIVGNYFGYFSAQGIVESGTIKSNKSNVYGSGNKISTAYVNSKKVNLIKNLEEKTDNYVGIVYEDSPTGNINLYDKYLDTWLGGDNDGSGYYFDYESETSNKIVLRSNPINTKFEKGSGTKESPYLIYNAEDMKKIAAMPKVQNYYKLMSDIDYNNEHYYMIGTRNEEYSNKSYYFAGIIDGNLHTIKNVEVKGYNNIGLIGYANSAGVQGLNVENATIVGNNNVGLFGYVSGENSNNPTTIVGLNIKNINVKGNSNVGGVAGYLFTNAKINEIAIDGNIEATGSQVGGIVGYMYASSIYVTSVISNTNVTGYDNVGGLVGNYFSYGAVQGVVESGTIKGENNVYGSGNKISNAYVSNAYVNEKVVITSTGSSSGIGGTEFSESYYNNLQYYGNLKLNSNVVVETPYSGDIDASGYYFNYNNDGTDIIVVKANNSSQSSTTGSVVYTKTVTEGDDKKAPTCTIGRYSVHGNGFTASYTCTDNTKVKARKHIYWVAEPNKVNYEDLISWPSTTDSSSETVSSVWTVESSNNIGIEPPSKGSCYYFYYGAQDEAGNTVIYATPNCISY